MIVKYRNFQVDWQIEYGKWVGYAEPIQKPFYYKGDMVFSLNDKIIDAAIERNAVIKGKVGEKEYQIRPNKKIWREKKKAGMIEEIPSKFPNCPCWYRLLFKI